MMQGILIVDKPTDWTSFDVIAKLRGILGTRKLGHSGTLDPMATGVLPVFCGGASKAVDLQLDHTKAYRAVLRLGQRTDTGDVTGTVLETTPVTAGEQELLAVLPQFLGPRMQTPPMYSAVKINGQPLYKLAREGKTVERKARPIEILDIRYEGSPAENEYALTVKCSKGTYIRVLLEEIAEAMGQKGTMSALRRVAAGVYTEADAHTLEEIQAASEDIYENIDLKRAIENLDPKDRAIVVLRFFEDRQLEEIAKILDENLNTVKSRLYRVMKKLRLNLEGSTG